MAVRLRYRVESPARFRSHLHLVDGTGYFFYPGRTAGRGEAVLLEVTFDVTGENIVLRGWVWAKPRPHGMWLELPGAGSAIVWADMFSRRAEHRLATEQMVLIEAEGKSALLCRLRDVSAGGARLGAAAEDVGNLGERIRVSLPEAGPTGLPLDAQAFVSWAKGGEIGVAWVTSDLSSRIAAARLVEHAEEEWESSAKCSHPHGCPCAVGRREAPLVVVG